MSVSPRSSGDCDATVFLSHRGSTDEFVSRLADHLSDQRLRLFIDHGRAAGHEGIDPGDEWHEALEEELRSSDAVLFCIGAAGFGGYQKTEFEAALILSHNEPERRLKLLPVLLPGGPDPRNLPLLLQRFTALDFRAGLNDAQRLETLVAAIKSRSARSSETGPATVQGVRPDQDRLIDESIRRIWEAFKDRRLVFMIGTPDSEQQEDYPPGSSEIAAALLRDLKMRADSPLDRDELLPPLDYAGEYYRIKNSLPSLQKRVQTLILERSRGRPPLYRHLTELLSIARQRKQRGETRPKQLLVTTNLDLMLECALVEAGINFTRLVQIGYPEMQVKRFQNRPLDPAPLRHPHNPDQLVEWVARASGGEGGIEVRSREGVDFDLHDILNAEEYPEPIVYKLHGSVDVRDSCALSTDQYFALVRRHAELVPKALKSIVKNSATLLLNYELLEPDLIMTYHLLKEAFTDKRGWENFAVANLPTSPLRKIWGHRQQAIQTDMNITVVPCDDDPDQFWRELATLRP